MYTGLKRFQSILDDIKRKKEKSDESASSWKIWEYAPSEPFTDTRSISRNIEDIKDTIATLEFLYTPYWNYLNASLNEISSPLLSSPVKINTKESQSLVENALKKRIIRKSMSETPISAVPPEINENVSLPNSFEVDWMVDLTLSVASYMDDLVFFHLVHF
jgi:hypothetical protein